jgi:hypothetical protein
MTVTRTLVEPKKLAEPCVLHLQFMEATSQVVRKVAAPIPTAVGHRDTILL